MAIVTVGIDLAKNVFALHGVDEAGVARVKQPRVARGKLNALVAALPPCVIGVEACSGAHYWARQFQAHGHTVRLMAPELVTPYRMTGKRGKNDAADAAAICEAVARPDMRFVPIKTEEQQSRLMVHRARQGFVTARTARINRIRGLLGEFGLVFAQSPAVLQAVLGDVLEDGANEMNTLARLVVQRAQAQRGELDEPIAWCDGRIAAHAKDNPAVKTAATLLGIGSVTASAVVTTVADFKQFRNGAQFGAWIGLVPRQRSSGGKNNLGGITKRGDTYLRSLLIQGAKLAVMTAHKRSDPISQWAAALRDRVGWQKAAVAMANKNARILWAVMTKGEAFDARHVSVKPKALASAATPR